VSVPRYPEYQDTHIDWLGRLPAHWTLPPLYARYEIVLGKMLDSKRITGKHLVPYIRNIDVQWDQINVNELPKMDVIESERDRFTLKSGDLLVCEGGEPGRAAFWCSKLKTCAFQKALHRVRSSSSNENLRYLFYCLRFIASKGVFDAQGNPNTISHLTGEQFRVYRFPCPSVSEQTAIVAFLDRETAKIDSLIEEQHRLIELLKEKRQAVISHAVRKGLNPDVQMKPSGIESFGNVPAHWDVMELKRDLAFVTSGSRGWASQYSDDGELFIRIANLTRDSVRLDLTDVQRVAVPDGVEGVRTRVQAGDVLFSITAYLGSVAIVPEGLEPAYVSQHVALARLRQARLTPAWVGYVATSAVGRTWFDAQSYGGTKIQLSLDDIRTFPVPVPPIREQRDIVEFIERGLARFDALIEVASRAIELLLERHTALISAAVTGQIDVRSLVPQEAV
jgi:type I restriction enzyme S subunit